MPRTEIERATLGVALIDPQAGELRGWLRHTVGGRTHKGRRAGALWEGAFVHINTKTKVGDGTVRTAHFPTVTVLPR